MCATLSRTLLQTRHDLFLRGAFQRLAQFHYLVAQLRGALEVHSGACLRHLLLKG